MNVTLYQPDMAQNLGSVLRLCACFQVDLSVIEPCGFPLTDKALRRTAMDYGNPRELRRYPNWQDFLESNPKRRIILFTTRGDTSLPDFKFRPDDCLLFGRESAGVPSDVFARADHRIIIPIAPDARSFNLATSAALGLYEALRQRGGFPAL